MKKVAICDTHKQWLGAARMTYFSSRVICFLLSFVFVVFLYFMFCLFVCFPLSFVIVVFLCFMFCLLVCLLFPLYSWYFFTFCFVYSFVFFFLLYSCSFFTFFCIRVLSLLCFVYSFVFLFPLYQWSFFMFCLFAFSILVLGVFLQLTQLDQFFQLFFIFDWFLNSRKFLDDPFYKNWPFKSFYYTKYFKSSQPFPKNYNINLDFLCDLQFLYF